MFISLVLAGCLPQVQATPTLTQAPTETTFVRPAPTIGLSVPTETTVLDTTGCTVKTKKPTPGPTPTSIFPAVSDKEWIKGSANAKVTIIEYSDYQ